VSPGAGAPGAPGAPGSPGAPGAGVAAGAVALLSVPGAGLFWLHATKTNVAAEKMSVLNTFVFMTFPLNVSAAQRRAGSRATPDGRERTKPKTG
jgi:hypothetical protein